jgi:hypothetical protein
LREGKTAGWEKAAGGWVGGKWREWGGGIGIGGRVEN